MEEVRHRGVRTRRHPIAPGIISAGAARRRALRAPVPGMVVAGEGPVQVPVAVNFAI